MSSNNGVRQVHTAFLFLLQSILVEKLPSYSTEIQKSWHLERKKFRRKQKDGGAERKRHRKKEPEKERITERKRHRKKTHRKKSQRKKTERKSHRNKESQKERDTEKTVTEERVRETQNHRKKGLKEGDTERKRLANVWGVGSAAGHTTR